MSGSCKKVYISHVDSVACVNAAGQVYAYLDWNNFLVNSSRAFNNIAVSTTRGAVATTTNGEIYYKHSLRSAQEWESIPGVSINVGMENVGISKDYIVATTPAGSIFWLDLKR